LMASSDWTSTSTATTPRTATEARHGRRLSNLSKALCLSNSTAIRRHQTPFRTSSARKITSTASPSRRRGPTQKTSMAKAPRWKMYGGEEEACTLTPPPSPQVKAVYVGSLPEGFSEERMRELFGQYGAIAEVTMASALPNAKRKDFGFVEFVARESARKAVAEVNGRELFGHRIEVALRRPVGTSRPLSAPPAMMRQPCKYFFKDGHCGRGLTYSIFRLHGGADSSRCPMSHENPHAPLPSYHPPPQPAMPYHPAPAFATHSPYVPQNYPPPGVPQGPRVVPAQSLKTRLCTYFQKGSCQRGAACHFAHGEDELRPIQSTPPPRARSNLLRPQCGRTRRCRRGRARSLRR
jgi:hypothetical protein